MKFSIFVNCPPTLPAAKAALRFCQNLSVSNHTLHRVFFFEDGVLNSAHSEPLCDQWAALISKHQLDAVCCVNACVRVSLANGKGKATQDMHPAFKLAGLGQLVEASVASERCITFGQRTC